MAWCFHCQGMGTVECFCGGDLCVCLNYGERDCPVCHGDGDDGEGDDALYYHDDGPTEPHEPKP